MALDQGTMNGRRQHNGGKGSKRRQRKDVQVLNTMEKYLDYNVKEEVVVQRNGYITNGFKDNISIDSLEEVILVNGDSDHQENIKTEEMSPLGNVRLSPRKHASTLSRCAATAKENVKTPHRISLCELETNPYTKRTRRRLNVGEAEEDVEPSKGGAQEALENKKIVTKEESMPHAVSNTSCKHPNNTHPSAFTNGHVNGERKLTEFFPVRRSVRKTKKEVLEEKLKAVEMAILEQREDGLEVAVFEGKGRGVVAARMFRRGDFVVEYAGELVSIQEAKEREAHYAQDTNKGCYMYYFKHNNTQYCIDATAESGRLGRLVNHSRNGNLVTKPVFLHRRPHLVLLASQDILPGEEVTYDYGDRSKESLLAHPWLAF